MWVTGQIADYCCEISIRPTNRRRAAQTAALAKRCPEPDNISVAVTQGHFQQGDIMMISRKGTSAALVGEKRISLQLFGKRARVRLNTLFLSISNRNAVLNRGADSTESRVAKCGAMLGAAHLIGTFSLENATGGRLGQPGRRSRAGRIHDNESAQ
jgi:hypothetical protein